MFTVKNNEHTKRFVLSSQLGDFVTDGKPKFTLRTPIISPMNMVCLVRRVVSDTHTHIYFSVAVVSNTHNAFDVYNAAGTFQYSIWSGIKDGPQTVQSNTQSLNQIWLAFSVTL